MKTVRTTVMHGAAAALLGAATILPLAGNAHAASQTETLGPNILQNGGFEQGANPGVKLAVPAGGPFLNNWTVVGSEAQVIGTYWKAQEGGRSLLLANYATDASKAMKSASGVTQTFPTTVGQRYRVVFYQSGMPDNMPKILRFQVGDQTRDYTYAPPKTATVQTLTWVQRSFVYTAKAASTSIAFYAFYTPGNDGLGLDNVQVRAILASATPTPTAATAQPSPTQAPASGTPVTAGAKVSLQIAAPSVAAGGKETIQVRTSPNASVALLIDYPDGSQLVVPARAGADGTYSYSWTVPAGLHGTVHVTVDAAGTLAQGSFEIN